MAINYDSYTQAGLDKAKGLLDSSVAATYPSYIPTQAKSPSQVSYYDYTPTAPMSQIQSPNYKGLMNGDYEALQQALTLPGQQAAQTAYGQGLLNLNSAMGGRGLYGSSIMGNQQVNGLDKVYQNALATNAANAAAQRYGMQATDLQNQNQFNLQDVAGQRSQAFDTARLAQTEASAKNAYGQNKWAADQSYADKLREWENSQNYEKNFLYQQQKNAYDQAQQEMLMNRALALSGQGAPLSQAASQQAAYLQAANQASNQAALNGYLGAGTGLLGAYLGSNSGSSTLSNFINNLWSSPSTNL